jgi:putative transposase
MEGLPQRRVVMKKRFTKESIIAIVKEAEDRMRVDELCRKHGISDATFKTGSRSLTAYRCLKSNDCGP